MLGKLAPSAPAPAAPCLRLHVTARAALFASAASIAVYAGWTVWKAGFAPAPTMGVVWGLGSLALGLGYLTYRGGPAPD